MTYLYSAHALSREACKCLPGHSCWTEINWNDLSSRLGKPEFLESSKNDSIWECQKDFGDACPQSIDWSLDDPFSWQNHSWAYISVARYGDFIFKPSVYTVAARDAQDISEAVKFAGKNKLKVVVKSGGHDYLGRSQDPDALLIWTHYMRNIEYLSQHEICGKSYNAMSVESGARWLEVYNALQSTNRYIPGGAVGSVGVSGFTLGGGYSILSRKFGPTAGYVREMELVRPDGKIITLNACNEHKDLFQTLKGSGNAAYGVVTKFIFETIEPFDAGLIGFEIKAQTDTLFKKALYQWLNFYRDKLDNEHFGNIIKIERSSDQEGGSISSDSLFYTGKKKSEILALMQDLEHRLRLSSHLISIDYKVYGKAPIKSFRSKAYSLMYLPGYKESGSDPNLFYKPHNGTPTLWNISGFESVFLNQDQFDHLDRLSQAIFDATGHFRILMQMSKALHNASTEAVKRVHMTTVNKKVLETPAFITISGGGIGHNVSESYLREEKQKIKSAFEEILKLFPNKDRFATYGNQSSYSMKNWQSAIYGENEYQDLLNLKKEIDPEGLFTCHHCVGNELWDDLGCQVKQRD